MRVHFYFLIVILLLGCKSEKAEEKKPEPTKLSVVAVNYPLYYFAQRIGGDRIELTYPIPSEVDPAHWKPSEEDLKIYQSADLILANGAGYAGWMKEVSLASQKIVRTLNEDNSSFIPQKEVSSHSHGPEGEHEHETVAFTTWLDFGLALQQAEAVKNALVSKAPDHQQEFEASFENLKRDLIDLDERMTALSTEVKNVNLIASHPVYQYMSSAYGLHIHSVHFEPDVYPSKKQWHDLKHQMSKKKKNVMIWEAEPNDDIQDQLNKLNISYITFDPCSNQSQSGDFLSVMMENLNKIESLKEE